MKQLAGNYLLFFLILLIGGCAKENSDNKRLSDSYFIVDTDIKDYNSGQYSDTIFELDAGVGLFHHYYYLGFERDHVCWNIQFYYPKNRSNYMVKIRRFDDGKFKAFFIRWENGPSGYKLFEPEFTLYTNLDENKIKELFPLHKGKVIKENVKTIEVNNHFYHQCRNFIWSFDAVNIVN